MLVYLHHREKVFTPGIFGFPKSKPRFGFEDVPVNHTEDKSLLQNRKLVETT